MTSRPRPQARLTCRHPSHPLMAILATCALLLVGCQADTKPDIAPGPPAQVTAGPLNTTFVIEGRPVPLAAGRHVQRAAPGSNSKIVTRVWGAPLSADMNGDGTDDAVLILAQSTGGSGTFYYVVAAIAGSAAYEGSAGLLLGDRIKPQGIELVESKARISYLTRDVGESFADEPSVPRQMDVIYIAEDGRLAEVAIDFEGEADPNRMDLQMHTWTWVKTLFNDDTIKRPAKSGVFTLTFGEDGRVMGSTDCNSFHGKVRIEDRKMRFDENMAMTRKYCADSQEMEFIRMLQSVNSFFFTGRGELILELKYDSGSMFFR